MYICLEGSVHVPDFIVGCVGSGACVAWFAQPFTFLSCGTVLACHILDFATSACVRVKYYFSRDQEKKRVKKKKRTVPVQLCSSWRFFNSNQGRRAADSLGPYSVFIACLHVFAPDTQ